MKGNAAMPYRKSPTVEFDGKPTLDDVIEALQDLRGDHGGDALVRVRGSFAGFSTAGPYVKAITVEKPEEAESQ
jgi:hypothetical protein